MKIPYFCANCKGLEKTVVRIDEESTECIICGFITDLYETLKYQEDKENDERNNL